MRVGIGPAASLLTSTGSATTVRIISYSATRSRLPPSRSPRWLRHLRLPSLAIVRLLNLGESALLKLLRESHLLAKSLDMRILSKRVEFRNCESKTDSNRAQRSHFFQSLEGAILITHTTRRKGTMIRHTARSAPPRSCRPLLRRPKLGPKASQRQPPRWGRRSVRPWRHPPRTIDAFPSSTSWPKSGAAETFISYYTLGGAQHFRQSSGSFSHSAAASS